MYELTGIMLQVTSSSNKYQVFGCKCQVPGNTLHGQISQTPWIIFSMQIQMFGKLSWLSRNFKKCGLWVDGEELIGGWVGEWVGDIFRIQMRCGYILNLPDFQLS